METLQEKGNKFFRSGQFRSAIAMYSKAIEIRCGRLKRECIQSLFVLLVFDTVKCAVEDVKFK